MQYIFTLFCWVNVVFLSVAFGLLKLLTDIINVSACNIVKTYMKTA